MQRYIDRELNNIFIYRNIERKYAIRKKINLCHVNATNWSWKKYSENTRNTLLWNFYHIRDDDKSVARQLAFSSPYQRRNANEI